MSSGQRPEDVLTFWFGGTPLAVESVAARARDWFVTNPGFDREIETRFGTLPARAEAGELATWAEEPRSALALVIVCDQFPRNLFRQSAQAFAYDARARAVTRAALAAGFDRHLHPVEATFLYLPLEHSEALADQERCVALFEALLGRTGDDFRSRVTSFGDYARQHREVIRRFGRFPHRNAVLGRESTAEEVQWLEAGGGF